MSKYVKKEPNFIIAGSVAAGTGFLCDSIKNHPEIYLPKIMIPECGFFFKSWEFAKGKEYYLKKWFHEIKPKHIAIGERSSLYIHGFCSDIDVAKRIKQFYPNIKLIFCIRNPTERAYANYRFTALCGFENLSFKEALEKERERSKKEKGCMSEIQPHIYRARGCYYDQLLPFYHYFDKKQILCIKSESLAKNTEKELKKVFRFLEIDENFVPCKQKNYSSLNVRSLYLQEFFRKVIPNFDTIAENSRIYTRFSFFSRLVLLNLTIQKKPMEKDTRRYLNAFYASHNKKLEKLLKWDLSDWN